MLKIYMNSNKTNKNIKYSEFITKFKPYYSAIYDYMYNVPLITKSLNVLIPLSVTYYYTIINLNMTISIIFAILTSIALLFYIKILGLLFIIFYIIIVINRYNLKNRIIGKPIAETDLINGPFDATGNALIIPNTSLDRVNGNNSFTYSFWIYVNGTDNIINKTNNWLNYRNNEWKSVFYRGSLITNDNKDLTNFVQYPGVWLTPKTNNLVIVFQNATDVERLEINNIEFNQWNNFIIVVETRSISVYVNGLLFETLNLQQNTLQMQQYSLYLGGDKLLSSTGNKSGFAGYISYLTYLDYALNVNDIAILYNYYKEILDTYQNNKLKKNTQDYKIKLITN